MFRVISVLLAALVAAIVVGGMIVGGWLRSPVGEGTGRITLEVERGSSPRAIVQLLEDRGVVRDGRPFHLYLRVLRAGGELQAGTFHLDPSDTPAELLEALRHGGSPSRLFVVPEGFRATQIAGRAASLGLTTEAEFLAIVFDEEGTRARGFDSSSLEGYLYPDSYEVPEHFGASQLVDLMVKRWQAVWERDLSALAEARGRSAQWVVSVASIVEKETGSAEERGRIAGVFTRRLEQGMKLQADPTIIYGLKNYDGNIRKRDISDPHPWNTYVHKGVPPTAICSPGEKAMSAVLDPEPGDDLYFVAIPGSGGRHDFSATYPEHARKVRRYLP